MWGYLVYCVCFCLFLRLLIFQRRKKTGGVKLRTLLRLLSRQVFSHFGELWPAWSHGGGITSGMSYICESQWDLAAAADGRRGLVGSRNWGRCRRARPYGGISSCKPADVVVCVCLSACQPDNSESCGRILRTFRGIY